MYTSYGMKRTRSSLSEGDQWKAEGFDAPDVVDKGSGDRRNEKSVDDCDEIPPDRAGLGRKCVKIIT